MKSSNPMRSADLFERRRSGATAIGRRRGTPVRPALRDSSNGLRLTDTWEDVPELLTAKELEEILKIAVKTIYTYVQKGLIPYVRIQSNVRFVKHEILDWIERQSYRPKTGNANGTRKE